MHCWITIVGGLRIMMGQHSRSEALFYYFRLEDQVPENHLRRLVDQHIDLAFVREKLKENYSGLSCRACSNILGERSRPKTVVPASRR
jgi:hypothetical protein